MKKSWNRFFRNVATTCMMSVASATAWQSAVCYAVGASDNASDPVYADGWLEGDNGGTGFTAWNFDGTYASTVQQRIDDGLGSGALGSSTFNNIGRAWSMYNPVEEGSGGQRDIARSGRGFAPLQIGQTLKVTIDNPTEQLFFRGYFVRLTGNTGGVNGNICYNGTPCTPGAMPKNKLTLQMFEYFTYGQWGIAHGDGPDPGTQPDFTFTGLFDKDTVTPPQVGTDSGMRFEVKLTGAESYEAKMIPLDNPGATFTHTGVFQNAGFSVDWIEFLHFNTQSEQGFDTDFFIRSIEITSDILADDADFDGDGDVDGRDFLKWQRGFGSTGQTNNQNGDANHNGTVNGIDLGIWQSQYGVGPLLGVSSIPEPTCVSLLTMSAGTFLIGLGRRI